MSFQRPTSRVSTYIEGLGQLDGLRYATGVQQFCGIPYATLSKRWTRSVLCTSWKDNYHDGTQLGNDCPRPKASNPTPDNPFIPVPPNPTFVRRPQTDEKSALVLNVVIPKHPETTSTERLPVLLWIHGGSLLYGSSNLGIYDPVNLVTHSVEIGFPVIIVTFNYRLGLGGFLASKQIAADLARDEFAGNGNFGFTDQVTASQWVQTYIKFFGGDSENVTVFGQSAGAISIGHQMAAVTPMKFHRAICMSGVGSTLLCLTPEEHEEIFEATCRYFAIDSSSADALNQLREIPEQDLADADPIIQGVASGTGNPCFDGWFYARNPQEVVQTPAWLRSFLLGDVFDEGLIFEVNLVKDTYSTIRETLQGQIQDEAFVDAILDEYGIMPNLSDRELRDKTCVMGAEAVFKIENYRIAIVNTQLDGRLFKYHFDQRSELPNILQGKAYHGLDVLYLFMNLDNKLSDAERKMSRDLATAWIGFAWGEAPWVSGTGHGPWKIWGPESKEQVETEEGDEKIRSYSRFDRVIELGTGELWHKYMRGLDYLLMKRGNLGKFSVEEEMKE